MAKKRVDLELKVSDEGSAKLLVDTLLKVSKSLDVLSKKTDNANKKLKQLGAKGRTGADNLSKEIKRTEKDVDNLEVQQQKLFDTARGTAQASGAAARDFANQSRGLGGLVRIYATFAANIFALGAAYRGLSTALDTSNMIKGLDALGAASGRNLGGLSAMVAELSGGAISLADSMRAVAITSSGGVTTENIKRIAVVARQASTALGVSMPDAVSRLSRAITKLEPELLDELGIMTRIEPAAEKYARSVGKATSQLTRFEVRQAFANAVLDEGEEKFSAIGDIAVNPFDKLVSSLEDTTHSMLEFLNKGLAPVVNMLSANPTTLMAGILALTAIITKQTIPALTSYREKVTDDLNSTLKETTDRVKQAALLVAKLDTSKAGLKALKEKTFLEEQSTEGSILKLESEQEAIIKRLEAARGKSLSSTSNIAIIAAKRIRDVNAAELEGLSRQAIDLRTRGRIKEADAVDELAANIKKSIALEKEFDALKEKQVSISTQHVAAQDNAVKKAEVAARKASIEATKIQMSTNAAYTVGLIGLVNAHELLTAEMNQVTVAGENGNRALTTWEKNSIRVSAATKTLGLAVSGFINGLSSLLNILTTLTVAYSLLDVTLNDNREKIQDMRAAADNLAASLKNLRETIKEIDRTNASKTISGIEALGNAFSSLNESVTKGLNSALDARKGNVGISRLFNVLFEPFGSGIESTIVKNLEESIAGGLEAAERVGLRDKLKADLEEALKIDDLNIIDAESDLFTFDKTLFKLSNEQITGVAKALEPFNKTVGTSAARLTEFKTASQATELAFAQFIQSTANNDPIFKVGAALENLATSMLDINENQDVIQEMNAVILEFTKHPKLAQLFGPKFLDNILETREALKADSKEITALQEKIETLSADIDKTPVNVKVTFTDENGKSITQNLDDFKRQELQDAKVRIEVIESNQVKAARDLFVQGMRSAFSEGSNLIAQAGKNASERAAIIIERASLAGLTGEEKAKKEVELRIREIDVRLQANNTTLSLIMTNERLAKVIELDTAQRATDTARKEGASPEKIAAAESEERIAKFLKDMLEANARVTEANATQALGPELGAKAALRSIGLNQKIAEQEQARQLVLAERQAEVEGSTAKILAGRLQDRQTELGLQEQALKAASERLVTSQQVVGFITIDAAQSKAVADIQGLILRQERERLDIEHKIEIAANGVERAKQEEYLTTLLSKQQDELKKQTLQSSLDILRAEAEERKRSLEVTIAANNASVVGAEGRLAVRTAEVNALSQAFGIVQEYNIAETERLGILQAELEAQRESARINAELAAFARNTEAQLKLIDPEDLEGSARLNAELTRRIQLATHNNRIVDTRLKTQKQILAITAKTEQAQTRFNRALSSSEKISDQLSKHFGTFGKSLGSIAKVFTTMAVDMKRGNVALAELIDKRGTLAKDSEDFRKNEEAIALQRSINLEAQLAGLQSLASAGKQFFDEQSKGYRVLSAVEKAFAVLQIALNAQRIISSIAVTETEVANAGVRTTAKVAEAEVDGVAAVIKTISSLPFPANLAAGAAIAAVIAALIMTIGGKGPKVGGASDVGLKAEDVQEVQGTGQTFVNGRKIFRSGGLLGDNEAKVESIANSLEVVKDNTNITSIFGVQAVDLLSQIELNTRGLSAELIRTTNIFRSSNAFGADVGSSFKRLKSSPLLDATAGKIIGSLFGTKTKIEVIDKGVKAVGSLADILEGSQAFQEFEALEITKKKKRLGLTIKKKKSFEENTRDLERITNESFVELFNDLIDVTVFAAKKAFGDTNTDIQRALDTFTLDFKVSGFELTGEEFAEAILSESSVVINQLVEKAFPALELFREVGEGFIDTLVRVASILDVTQDNFDRIGISLSAPKLQKIPEQLIQQQNAMQDAFDAALEGLRVEARRPSVEQQALVDSTLADLENIRMTISASIGGFAEPLFSVLNAAERDLAAAKAAIFDNKTATEELAAAEKVLTGELQVSSISKINTTNFITNDVIDLINATKTRDTAFAAVVDAVTDSTILQIQFLDNIVDVFGGLESFVEKTNFFFENFFSEEEQLASKTSEVNASLVELGNQGILTVEQVAMLTDGVGNLRMEFRNIIEGIEITDTATAELANTLISFAPAIAEISDDIDEASNSIVTMANRLKLFTDAVRDPIKSLLSDAFVGGIKESELTSRVASAINEGFIAAANDVLVNEMTETIISSIITPILNGVLQGTVATSLAITAVMDNIVERFDNLAKVLASPQIRNAFNRMFVSITSIVKDINSSAIDRSFNFTNLGIDDLVERLGDLSKELEIEKLDLILERERERLSLLEEDASKLQEASDRLKDFSNTLEDFRNSLLTSDLSPLTPEEQLNAARSRFLELSSEILNPATSEEDRDLALSRIQESASTFLEASQVFFASSPNFISDFNFVQDTLDQIISMTSGIAAADIDPQLEVLKQQITETKDLIKSTEEQRKSLDTNSDRIAELTEEIERLTTLIKQQPALAAQQFTSNFEILDRDFSNTLTFEELQASGIASDEKLQKFLEELDTSGDRELSRFEVINGALGSTAFTLDSLASIVEALNSNIITLAEARASINDIQGANQSVEAELVSGSTSTGGTFDIQEGQLSRTKATIEGANVIIKNSDNILGVPISLEQAKKILMESAQKVVDGTLSAEALYNQLIAVGATSQIIADILGGGVTAAAVNNFFQSRNPDLPSFAKGTNFLPEDMVIQAHKGERIIPEADNVELIESLSNSNRRDNEAVNQLILLNEQVIRMMTENRENTGALVEAAFESGTENAQMVSNSNRSLSDSKAWFERTKAEVV